MFMGEYRFNIDEKGRLFIPVEFRKNIGSSVVISCGIEKCLTVYTLDSWKKYVDKIDTLVSTKKINREYKRLMMSRAYEKEIDTKGRVKIESTQAEYATLTKECVVLGSGAYIEIWDKAQWEKYLQDHLSTLEQLSEEIEFDV